MPDRFGELAHVLLIDILCVDWTDTAMELNDGKCKEEEEQIYMEFKPKEGKSFFQ